MSSAQTQKTKARVVETCDRGPPQQRPVVLVWRKRCGTQRRTTRALAPNPPRPRCTARGRTGQVLSPRRIGTKHIEMQKRVQQSERETRHVPVGRSARARRVAPQRAVACAQRCPSPARRRARGGNGLRRRRESPAPRTLATTRLPVVNTRVRRCAGAFPTCRRVEERGGLTRHGGGGSAGGLPHIWPAGGADAKQTRHAPKKNTKQTIRRKVEP
jgi:hypothetical protein